MSTSYDWLAGAAVILVLAVLISLIATDTDSQLVPQLSPQFPGSPSSAREVGVNEMMPAGGPYI